jgi:NAD(P)-dependent dehydrogenase (short-subunit alcohol dehydrogenase family)
MEFAGKSVLVTGASRGIGKATAAAFLAAGARVAVNGRTDASVAAAIADLGEGADVIAAPGNVAEVSGCEAIVRAALDGLGGLDVLVNSAGIFERANMADTDEAIWDAVIDANLKGTFFCSRAAVPALAAAKGVIINVSSESGLNGYRDTTAYCASKGAVVNLTRSMAIELAPEIRVNCVCPGVIDTDMARAGFAIDGDQVEGMRRQAAQYPTKRVGTVEEVAASIMHLSSPAAGFINGAILAIDGGATAGG